MLFHHLYHALSIYLLSLLQMALSQEGISIGYRLFKYNPYSTRWFTGHEFSNTEDIKHGASTLDRKKLRNIHDET